MPTRIVSIAALLVMGLVLAPATVSHAQSPRTHARDQSLGQWNTTCRTVWGNSAMTITFGSDGSWARDTCSAIVNDSNSLNQYQYFPLDQPRPGRIQCAYIYTYGGYWLQERAPYTQGYAGAAQVAVRDDLSYDDAGLADGACGSFGQIADSYNYDHGFNTSADPLAPIQQCNGCSGGGGGGAQFMAGNITAQVPNTLKAKHSHKKAVVCISNPHKGMSNPQHLPSCKH